MDDDGFLNFDAFDAFANVGAFSDLWADQAAGNTDDDETRETISPRAFRMRARRNMTRIKHKQTLRELIRSAPESGEEIHIVGANAYQFYTWLPVMLDWIGHTDEYYCATWTANAQSARDFFDLCDAGKICGEVGFMFGLYFKRREPVVYSKYAEELHRRGGWIKSFETHAKIQLLNNTARGDYLVIEG